MASISLQQRIDQIQWYHDIDFPNGLKARTTFPEAEGHRKLWEWMRSELDKIDFAGKTVLDIGCWDGYWSFYAEQRGASRVLASDDKTQNFAESSGLELAKELMGSSIETRTDVSVYEVTKLKEQFDIILCMGVFYHLVDPFLAFSQVRHCTHGRSIVVFEGDFAPDWFVQQPHAAYVDLQDPWHCFMPTVTCLRQMLEANYFRVQTESLYYGQPTEPVNRILVASEPFEGENVMHRYRPPLGLHVYDPRFSDTKTAPSPRIPLNAAAEPTYSNLVHQPNGGNEVIGASHNRMPISSADVKVNNEELGYEFQRIRGALADLRNLSLRMGELPPQPPTFRARLGAQLVRMVRRMLFWYTPQIVRAQMATTDALTAQVQVLRKLVMDVQRLDAVIEELSLRLRGLDDLRSDTKKREEAGAKAVKSGASA